MSGYQHIREQLVGLNVDLDDKRKICAHLEEKIVGERAKLSRVETELNVRYEDAMENEFGDRQKEMTMLKGLSDQLVNEKKEHVKICQVLMEMVTGEESDVAAEGRRLNREALEALDMEKKSFRASHPERLQNFLASKAETEKEKTGKALQPEFSRLQRMHEREIAEAEEHAKSEERKMRSYFQGKLEELVREERQSHEDSQKNLQHNRHNAVNTELDASEREHRMRLLTTQSDAEKDLNKLKNLLEAKVDKERKEGYGEVMAAQETFQKRVHEIRSRHASEVSTLLKDHDEQIKAIRLRASERKLFAEQEMIGDTRSGSIEDLVSKDADRKGKEVENSTTKQMQDEVQRERDRKLQCEIRSLQAQSVRLERSWKSKAAEERQFVIESNDKEQRENSRRHRQLNEETAELMSLHELLANDVRRAQELLTKTSNELDETRNEIDVYEGGLAAHRNRIRDMQSLCMARMRDDESSNQSRVEATRARLERIRSRLQHKKNSTDRELADLESRHVTDMEALDGQVKVEVARKDEDLDLLRDAVHSEKVKVTRLEKLIRGHMH